MSMNKLTNIKGIRIINTEEELRDITGGSEYLRDECVFRIIVSDMEEARVVQMLSRASVTEILDMPIFMGKTVGSYGHRLENRSGTTEEQFDLLMKMEGISEIIRMNYFLYGIQEKTEEESEE